MRPRWPRRPAARWPRCTRVAPPTTRRAADADRRPRQPCSTPAPSRPTSRRAGRRALPALAFDCLGGGTLDLGRAPGRAHRRQPLGQLVRPLPGGAAAAAGVRRRRRRPGARRRASISKDGVPQAESFAADAGVTFPSAFDGDGELMAELGLNGLPYTYFLDADGGLVAQRSSARSTSVDELRGARRRAPRGAAVTAARRPARLPAAAARRRRRPPAAAPHAAGHGDGPAVGRPDPVRRGSARPRRAADREVRRTCAATPASRRSPAAGSTRATTSRSGRRCARPRRRPGIDPAGVRVLATLQELFLPPSDRLVVPVVGVVGRPAGRDRRRSARGGAGRPGPAGRPHRPGQPVPGARTPSGFVGPAFAVADMLVWGFTAGLLEAILEAAGLAEPWDERDVRPLPPSALRPYAPARLGRRRRGRGRRRADGRRSRARRPSDAYGSARDERAAPRGAGRRGGGLLLGLLVLPVGAVRLRRGRRPPAPDAHGDRGRRGRHGDHRGRRRPGDHPADPGRLRLHPRHVHRGPRARCA